MPGALPSYLEAAELVAARSLDFAMRRLREEQVELSAAANRVLAVPLRADRDMPSFPRSTRDGFAGRAAEISAHQFLTVAGSSRAGDPPAGPLPGSAVWEIMTGAAVPQGADAVVMVEHVEHEKDAIRMVPGRSLVPGENIVARGAEAHAGDEIVPSGTRLTAPQIAAAATCGFARLEVFAKPRIGILTTGDELVDVSERPGPGQIRNSNAQMLAVLVAAAGGEPWILPTARDNARSLNAALRQARSADMLLISGGVSAGKFDLVEPALAELGAKFHFTGVRIQPGKPLVFGELPADHADRPEMPFFGLPGNPISSAATFLLFATPVLSALSGASEVRPRFAMARLSREIKGKPGLSRFVPAACTFQVIADEPPSVAAVQWQGSGDLAAFARANCFLAVPEGTDSIPAGELVRILPFF